MAVKIWTNDAKNIYVGVNPVKEVYVWTTKVRPTELRPFSWDNIYAFSDGIYTGTDSSPKQTRIASSTIYDVIYDRENGTLWGWTSNWIWYFNNDMSFTQLYNSTTWSYKFLSSMWNYIYWLTSETWPTHIFSRKTKSYIASVTSDTSYSKHGSSYEKWDNILVWFIWWYNTYKAYNSSNGTLYKSITCPHYSNGIFIYGKWVIGRENWWGSIELWNPATATITSLISTTNTLPWGTIVKDTWYLSRVSTSDWEYGKTYVTWVRNNTNCYLIDVISWTWTALWNAATANGIPIKYNSSTYIMGNQYCWCTKKVWSTYTNLATTSSDQIESRLNITSSWNITIGSKWIININGGSVYSSTSLIAWISKTLYNW